MRMGMRLVLNTDLRQELTLTGGATDSILVEAERRLRSSTKYLEAVLALARRKQVDGKYWSVMDFLVCGLFPEFEYACMAYYENRGPQLVHMIDDVQIRMLDIAVNLALDVALKVSEAKDAGISSWFQFRSLFKRDFWNEEQLAGARREANLPDLRLKRPKRGEG